MLKKMFVLITLATIIFSGCGKKTVDLTEVPEKQETEASVTETEVVREEEKFFDKDVEIILTAWILGEETIEEYVESLRTQNPDGIFEVYDENHYSTVIKESERKEMLKTITDEESISAAFQDLFNAEETNGAYLSFEYDAKMENITFYVDKVKYDELGLFNFLVPYLTGAALSDSVQAYNLVPVEERKCKLMIIDNETKEIIYDSTNQ